MVCKEFKCGLVWLRRDLRLYDHRALREATLRCDSVSVLFIYDSVILDPLPEDDRRLTFINQSVSEVAAGLEQGGSALYVGHGDPLNLVPALAQSLGCDAVFASHDDDPYALERDKAVEAQLSHSGVGFFTYKDCVVLERQEVMKPDGAAYRVFTPYSKAWQNTVAEADLATFEPDFGALAPYREVDGFQSGNLSLRELGFRETDLWVAAGERAGRARLEQYMGEVSKYKEERDFPALESTSGLSVHLRFGTVSVRDCFRRVRQVSGSGAATWEKELIWREFYHMILANFPEVGRGQTFQESANRLHWPGDRDLFTIWCQGKTGYPLVDAAMRCFNATGWMHNRLRMVVAMFLTKDLLVDWSWGEEYFAAGLLDFELASNNGGWQWSASTGADGQPYFRIFNPILQSRKFDPNGDFIRKWCPELNDLDSEAIHWPFEEDGTRTLMTPGDWPNPVVMHHEQKAKVMALFESR